MIHKVAFEIPRNTLYRDIKIGHIEISFKGSN
jgi:hypothetical protein